MSTWKGWEAQLVKTLGVGDTLQVGDLFTTWSKQVSQKCDNNPLAASRHATGSSNCRTLGNGKHAQNYKDHASAIDATTAQLRDGDYPHLWAAIKSGSPYEASSPQAVADDLTKWGAAAAGAAYQIEVAQGSYGGGGGGGGGSPPKAAHLHKGWADIRRSVNNKMPAALRNSQRSLHAGLRTVARARKVRL